MKKLIAVVLCVLVSAACATGGAFSQLSKPEKAKAIAIAFQQSWDEACTVEWLRCDVTKFADEAVGVYVDTVNAHPETWQSGFDAMITSIKSRAMVADLLGRWVFWLDAAQLIVDNIGKPV